MIPRLLLHDSLAPPKNHDAFWEVLDAQPRGGFALRCSMLPSAHRYIKLTDIHDDIYAGKRTLLARASRVSVMRRNGKKGSSMNELDIDHDMNVCGTPGQLVVDNGPETKGGLIQNLDRLCAHVKHCRASAGQQKAVIERLNCSSRTETTGSARGNSPPNLDDF